MSSKRNDLQGIRGIAILLVLIFHLKPNLFPYGFIGVDMFFVLSGYLMTKILSEKIMNLSVIYDFYTRRFKRIVPLFTVILTGVYLVCWYFVLSFDRLQLLTDLKWALTFTSNMQPIFEKKEYWDQITSYRFLVHCWSLGVEIQFYVIAPLLLCYCRKIMFHKLILLVFGASLIFQLMSPPKVAYGVIFSRVWQFLCGTLAFEVEEKLPTKTSDYCALPVNDSSSSESLCVYESSTNNFSKDFFVLREILLLSVVLIVGFNPEILDYTIVRLIGTFCTSVFICLPHVRGSFIAESRLFVYLGNILYTLYLVHWPVIVLYKYYYSLNDMNVKSCLICLLIVLFITISLFIIYAAFRQTDKAILMSPVVNWSNDTGMQQLHRNFDFYRLIGTFCTSVFICLPHVRGSFIAESRLFVYLGNILYTLYLVHWPVIVLYKYYYSLNDMNVKSCLICLLIVLFITISLHHTLENYLLCVTLRTSVLVFLCSIAIILLTSSVYQHDLPLNFGQETNETLKIERATEYNMFENNKCYFKLPCVKDDTTMKWTNYTDEPELRCQAHGNGSLKVLVIGNSIAYRAYPLIHDLFKERYETLRLYSRSSVATIASSTTDGANFEEAVRKTVEMMKPDVIFIIYAAFRQTDKAILMSPVVNWSNDTGMQQLHRNFDFYSKYTSQIAVDLPYYIADTRYALEIVKRLKTHRHLDDLEITREDLHKQQYWQHKRLRRIKCPKCILNDVNEALFRNGTTFRLYDPSTYFAYISDGTHFTPAGLELLRGKYFEVIEKLITTTKLRKVEDLEKLQ